MALIVRNISGSLVLVDDLGLSFAIGEDYDLSQDPPHDVSQSGDLESRLTAGELVFLDPLDNSIPLNTLDSIELFAHIAAPNFRIFGGDLNQLDDVNFIGTPANEDFLVHDGTTWRERTVTEVNAILGTTPGTGSDFAAVVLGLSANNVITTSFVDVVWSTTHFQNDITKIEHDSILTERVLIKETGTHDIRFNISFDADAGEEIIEAQVMQNGVTVIPGSFRRASEDDEINDLSNGIIANLTAGDYITLQVQASGAGNLLESSSNFVVVRVGGSNGTDGVAGPVGPTGSGSNVVIRDEGGIVIGGPYSELNFIGAEVNVTDAGSGQADITITATGGVGSNFAAVVLGQTIDIAIPILFTDVLWPVIHLENDQSILERDDTLTERILIKDTGTYDIRFNISFDADSGEETIEARIVSNGSVVVPGSFRRASEDDEINDLSNAIIAELVAGDYITLQVRATGTGNLLENTSNLCVVRVGGSNGTDGVAGPVGPTGSGSTIIIRDEGTIVSGGPHSEINFTGATVDATDSGGGVININISALPNVFGSEAQTQEDLISFSTNSTAFQQVMRMTTPALPTGTYRIGWSYNWNYDNRSRDFNGRIQIDDSTGIMEHKQEPKDAGADQRTVSSGFAYTPLSGVHDIDFDISTSNNGDNATVRDIRLEVWRIS